MFNFSCEPAPDRQAGDVPIAMPQVLQHKLTHRFASPDGEWHNEHGGAADFPSIVHAARFCADHGITDVNFLHLTAEGEPLMCVELCGSNHVEATENRL